MQRTTSLSDTIFEDDAETFERESESSSMEEEQYDNFAAMDDYDADGNDYDGDRDENDDEVSDDEFDFIGGNNHVHLDRAFDMNDDMKYCRLQENLYQSTFSLECLQDSRDIGSFLDNMPQYAESDITMVKLLHFRRKAKLSRTSGKELLSLLRALNPSLSIPDDWRSITRYVQKKCSFLDANTIRHVEPWPVHWRLDTWSQRTPPPAPREIICRDPLELLCLKCVDPTLQFINGGDIQFSYLEETLHDGTPCASNLMSSLWAKQTEREIKAIHPDGILFPIVVYADGVALGLRNKVRYYAIGMFYYTLRVT